MQTQIMDLGVLSELTTAFLYAAAFAKVDEFLFSTQKRPQEVTTDPVTDNPIVTVQLTHGCCNKIYNIAFPLRITRLVFADQNGPILDLGDRIIKNVVFTKPIILDSAKIITCTYELDPTQFKDEHIPFDAHLCKTQSIASPTLKCSFLNRELYKELVPNVSESINSAEFS